MTKPYAMIVGWGSGTLKTKSGTPKVIRVSYSVGVGRVPVSAKFVVMKVLTGKNKNKIVRVKPAGKRICRKVAQKQYRIVTGESTR